MSTFNVGTLYIVRFKRWNGTRRPETVEMHATYVGKSRDGDRYFDLRPLAGTQTIAHRDLLDVTPLANGEVKLPEVIA